MIISRGGYKWNNNNFCLMMILKISHAFISEEKLRNCLHTDVDKIVSRRVHIYSVFPKQKYLNVSLKPPLDIFTSQHDRLLEFFFPSFGNCHSSYNSVIEHCVTLTICHETVENR